MEIKAHMINFFKTISTYTLIFRHKSFSKTYGIYSINEKIRLTVHFPFLSSKY